MSNVSEAVAKLPSEQEAIRAKCFHATGAFVEFKKEEIEQSIPDRFEKIARLYPGRIAIKDRAQTVTYADLNERANCIAQAILERCGDGNEPVAILMNHGASVLVAILAVLKAGKIYVSLDPFYPLERLQFMLADSKAEAIVAHGGTISLAREVGGQKFPIIDTDDVRASSRYCDVQVKITPDAFASIFYTSGTTGRPKGVVDNHRNLLHGTLRFTNGLHISIEDRLSLTHSCSSSASVRRIFPALLNGACLCPLDPKKEGTEGLLDLLNRESITIFSSGRIRDFVRHFNQQQFFPSLRLVSIGGELVYRRDIELYKRIFPRDCIIGIWMSSTEAGNITQFFIDNETQLAGDIAPIGYPAQDVEVMLLDDAGNHVRQGDTGEIAVKSEYLSCGYWRQPELTHEKFRSDPAGGAQRIYRTGDQGRMDSDGCIFHLGRKDDQIKVRGYRVESAEVEAALLNLGHFTKAVVTLRDRGADQKVLVAYLVPEKRPAPSTSALRRALEITLPNHMIPSVFVVLDSLPLTPTQKVDRKALPQPGNTRPEIDAPFVAPRNGIEKVLSKIWCEVLSLDHVGIHDNFFDLGGHSLLAAKLCTQIEKTLGRCLPLATIFQAPTIEQLSDLLRQEEGSASQVALWSTYPSSVVPFQPNGSRPPLFWFNWGPWDFRLPRYLGLDQPVYGLQHQSQDGHRALYTSIEDMAAYYIKEIRTVQAQGPYYIGGLCIGGMVAFEMAQQLQKQCEEVALLVLLDPNNPWSAKSSATKDAPNFLSFITRFRKKVNRHLRELAPLEPHEKLSYALVRVQDRITGLRGRIRTVRTVLCEAFGCPLPLDLRTHYIANIYGRASRAYVPQPYHGRVILYKTQGRYRNRQLRWQHLIAGGLDIHELDTDHDNIFREPYVKTFAERLKLQLADAHKNVLAYRSSTVYSTAQ